MAIDEERQRVGWGRGGLTPQCQHGDEERLAGLPPLARHPWASHLPPLSPFCLPPPHPVSSPVSPFAVRVSGSRCRQEDQGGEASGGDGRR